MWTMLNFKGRMSRRNYWVGHGFYFILLIGGISLIGTILTLPGNSLEDGGVTELLMVVGMTVLVVLYAIACSSLIIRRAHDINSSGTVWLVVHLIVSGVSGIILGFLAGDKDSNQYGKPDIGTSSLSSYFKVTAK